MERKKSKKLPRHYTASSKGWLDSKKRVLKDIKRRVVEILGHHSLEIEAYKKDYDRSVHVKWRESSKNILIKKILKSRIVYGADFHAHAQSQRTHLRILRSLPADKNIILALECFSSSDQKKIDLYMKDKISEENFLIQVSWNKNWGFSWENYKPLLELSKKRGYKVIGLNRFEGLKKSKTLKSTDVYAAKILAKTLRDNSAETLVYVVFGELHVSRNHLPKQVTQRVKSVLESVTLFQNVEKIYFRVLLRQQELRINVVELKSNVFCILNSPPWVKWQSYLVFLEQSLAHKNESEDQVDQMSDLLDNQIEHLKREFNFDQPFDGLTLQTNETFNLRAMNFKKTLKPNDKKVFKLLKHSHMTFSVPQVNYVYLSKPSLNQVNLAAGLATYLTLSKAQFTSLKVPHDFKKLIWIEAMGYFCSKILNPGRKIDTLEDLIKKSAVDDRSDSIEVLKICINYKRHEMLKSRFRINFKPRHRSSYFKAARKLGAMVGEQIYWGYRNQKIHRRLVLSWLEKGTDSPDFNSFFSEFSSQLRKLPWELKSKEERL